MTAGLGVFEDKRLDRTGVFLLSRLVGTGGRSVVVRRLGGNRAGETRLTRFLRDDAVTVEEMLAEAARRTATRSTGRHVLAIQDTASVRSEGGGGSFLHAVVAVDAEDGALLGLVGGQFLERASGQRGKRRSLPVEKESFRWLQGAEEAASVCAGACEVTVVADREGGVLEAFALRPKGVGLLVRAAQDRSLDGGGPLFASLDALPAAGRATLEVPAGPGRRARCAEVAARFAAARLKRPRDGRRTGLAARVDLHVVDLREVDAPPGVVPVHWRLLTTHAVEDLPSAWAVAELYRKRWAIEQTFRTLKTKGFDVGALRIEDPAPRNKMVAAALVAAVCIQQLVHARDGGPGPLRPMLDAFEPEDEALLDACCAETEGRTARQKNPHPPDSLAYAAWVCARLGGWTGYYGKPGPIVMLQGWLEFHSMRRGASLFNQPHRNHSDHNVRSRQPPGRGPG